jgi:3,4-dihydroxy 2-butanone 4-phosphate synthase/GTP cyclohydrolase II
MFSNVRRAIKDIQSGKFVILTDAANRENEGDLVVAGQFLDPAKMAFLMTEARGLVCVSVSEYYTDKFELLPMTSTNQCPKQTAYTVTIDAKPTLENRCTTGISAYDRCVTVQTLLNPKCTSDDLIKPGHLQPLKAKNHGVLERQGHTEGSLALMQLAGLPEVAVICEMVKPDGSMARETDLQMFANKHSICVISIDEILHYLQSPCSKLDLSAKLPIRLRNSNPVHQHNPTQSTSDVVELRAYPLPGDNIAIFHPDLFTLQEPELVKQERKDSLALSGEEVPFVRVHSKCLTGDVFGSLRCDCGEQLQESLGQLAQQKNGLILYLGNQEGRGIGLKQKICSYCIQDKFGLDTVEANHRLGFAADRRTYQEAAFILTHYFKLKQIRLITCNPEKVQQLQQAGIQVTQINSIPAVNLYNERYLHSKQNKLGHRLFSQ